MRSAFVVTLAFLAAFVSASPVVPKALGESVHDSQHHDSRAAKGPESDAFSPWGDWKREPAFNPGTGYKRQYNPGSGYRRTFNPGPGYKRNNEERDETEEA